MHARPERHHPRWASRAGRYGVALLAFGAAWLIQASVAPFLPATPFLFFFGAVMVAGWWGGWGPAMATTLLSAVVVDFYFLKPLLDESPGAGRAVSLTAFAVLSLLMTKLNVMLRRANAERARLLERERAARSEAEAGQARLLTLFQDAPAGIILMRGPRHVYSFSNTMNNALMGTDKLEGREAREAVPWAETRGLISLMDEVYRTGVPFAGNAVPFPRELPNGETQETYLNIVYQPTRNEQGEVDGIVGFGFDVTDLVRARQRAEALTHELQQAEARDWLLAESGAVLASSLDDEATLRNTAKLVVPTFADWCLVDVAVTDGTFRRLEAAHFRREDDALAEDILRFGMQPSGNPGHPPTGALLKAETVHLERLTRERIHALAHNAAHARVMEAMGPNSLISVPLIARGQVLGVLSFIHSYSGRHYSTSDLAFAKELAHRAALSLENARLYAEAREAIRLRDEFMSIASHELKTPLTPLSLKLQALARELARNPGPVPRDLVERYVVVGARQVQKLAELVGDLLDVSRISAGRLSLEMEELELGSLVRDVVTRYEPQAARTGSSLLLEAGDFYIVGRWDRLRLEQIITNLVDNAVKYGDGKPIHVRLEPHDGGARLTVRDEGIGIAPEHLPRLFGRFERAVSERNYGGLGLGLYITRTLVEAMGGRVHVESTLGRGSTFTVGLPSNLGAEQALRAPLIDDSRLEGHARPGGTS
ncbi:GAF domain-containing protein [Myxococcus sp. AM001]|uniref:PAS domain-containing sensor histidine kinase n=1 Tax=Myxococcus vastator TaxID=2709664 RepID=UPI0013D4FF92|nr:ATP-binding protein [Myxococcus vastator]NVJ07961.1 GAF domain-containing protein [Myxococcus sp. AM001]